MKFTIILVSLISYGSSLAIPARLTRRTDSSTITTGGSFTLPITQVGASTVTLSTADLLSLLQDRVSRTGVKYGYASTVVESSSNKVLNSRASGSQQMGDGPNDFIYFASVVVGTPPVAFEVQLDTGSSDLILLSNPCNSGCGAGAQIYRPSDSSTAQITNQPFSIQYGSGAASGTLVTDLVNFAGFKMNQTLGALTDSTGIYHSSGSISGIFGLAWNTIAQSGATPFIQNLWQTGKLDQPLFAMAFARWKSGSLNPGGTITVGATNSAYFSGTINYVPSSYNDYWEIPLDDILVGGVSLGINNSDVLIDSGTSLVYFPEAQARIFYANIPGSVEAGGGIWKYSCNPNLKIAFKFGGISYNISSVDFNLGYATSDGKTCYGAVAYFSGADLWIFGDVFLKNVYTVFRFNPSAIGFATLVSDSLHSGSVPIGNGTTNTAATPSSTSTKMQTSTSISSSTVSSRSTSSLITSSSSTSSTSSSIKTSATSATSISTNSTTVLSPSTTAASTTTSITQAGGGVTHLEASPPGPSSVSNSSSSMAFSMNSTSSTTKVSSTMMSATMNSTLTSTTSSTSIPTSSTSSTTTIIPTATSSSSPSASSSASTSSSSSAYRSTTTIPSSTSSATSASSKASSSTSTTLSSSTTTSTTSSLSSTSSTNIPSTSSTSSSSRISTSSTTTSASLSSSSASSSTSTSTTTSKSSTTSATASTTTSSALVVGGAAPSKTSTTSTSTTSTSSTISTPTSSSTRSTSTSTSSTTSSRSSSSSTSSSTIVSSTTVGVARVATSSSSSSSIPVRTTTTTMTSTFIANGHLTTFTTTKTLTVPITLTTSLSTVFAEASGSRRRVGHGRD